MYDAVFSHMDFYLKSCYSLLRSEIQRIRICMKKREDKRQLYVLIGRIAAFVGGLALVLLFSLLRTPVSIQSIETEKVTNRKIRIMWSDEYDKAVKQYEVKRRNVDDQTNQWEVISVVNSDRKVEGETLFVEDVLNHGLPQQYVYRVDVKLANKIGYTAETGKERLASNVMICLDPGHYAGRNTIEGEQSYGYAEGDFTLALALEVKQILEEKYGIGVYMTRTTDHINIHGYRDVNLDSGNIHLRGMRAGQKDCDMFISLHTNANSDNAHGYETCMQPIGMNKPMILANTIACKDERTIAISNVIGTNLAKANYNLGTASVEEFVTAEAGNVEAWTGPKNDALDTPGTVYYRFRTDVEEDVDYYGVLRGSALVNKPGIIIEHGFHTVPEMRREAMEGNLKSIWADIDAYGIAYGFGFETEVEMTD